MTGAFAPPEALCRLADGRHLVSGKLDLSDPAGHDADPDVAGAAGSRVVLRPCLHAHSVAGGVLGYAVGALLYDSVGHWLIQLYGYGDKVEAFRAAYAQWGAWIILLKGLTPIPYKDRHDHVGLCRLQFLDVRRAVVHRPRHPLLSAGLFAQPLRPQARAIIEERLGSGCRSPPSCSSPASWLRYTCSEAESQFCHRIGHWRASP
jgi:hypothetical protein